MFEIPRELAQALLNYLASKPYAETHQLIGALQGMKEIKPKVETPEPDED